MYLCTLDKKQLTISQKFTNEEFAEILVKNKITEEQLVNEVQKQIYTQLAMGCTKNIRTVVAKNDKEVIYSVSGYILSPLNIKELVQEILELSDEDKQKYLDDLKTIPISNGKDKSQPV
jgi:hypothetical protein